MAITSDYSGGYEVKNIISKGVYNTQEIITASIQLLPEDKKTIFSLYYLDGYRTSIKVLYSLSSDNVSFSNYQEVINVSALGNYIFFYTSTDLTGYIKFKIEITGRAVMEFNQLGVLKGVRTRSFILLEGSDTHKIYQCYENLLIKDPVKLINISGGYKLAKLAGSIAKNEIDVCNNSALPQIEILGATVISCYRDSSNNMLMLKYGILNYDNTITWNTQIQVYSSALAVSGLVRSFTIKKLSESKFVIGFISNANAYLVGGDVINGVVNLGSVISAGSVSSSNPFCNIIRINDGKFIFCSFAATVNYPQYRCVSIAQTNTFTLGTNYSPLSSVANALNGCLINENDPSGILFAVGVATSGGMWIYSNTISGGSNVICEASVNISSSTNGILEFSIEQYNLARGILSYTVDDSVHKLTVKFFNISRTSVSITETCSTLFDASGCFSKIMGSGKILHIYFNSSAAKCYYVISDLLYSDIKWGSPVEIVTGVSSLSYSGRSLGFCRFVVLYCNESTHSTKVKVFEDDRNLFLGLMNENCSSGSYAEVKVISQICDKYSGLLPGEKYYLQSDGALSTTPTDYKVGVAISDTELFIQK